jgi:hypothetical protein
MSAVLSPYYAKRCYAEAHQKKQKNKYQMRGKNYLKPKQKSYKRCAKFTYNILLHSMVGQKMCSLFEMNKNSRYSMTSPPKNNSILIIFV